MAGRRRSALATASASTGTRVRGRAPLGGRTVGPSAWRPGKLCLSLVPRALRAARATRPSPGAMPGPFMSALFAESDEEAADAAPAVQVTSPAAVAPSQRESYAGLPVPALGLPLGWRAAAVRWRAATAASCACASRLRTKARHAAAAACSRGGRTMPFLRRLPGRRAAKEGELRGGVQAARLRGYVVGGLAYCTPQMLSSFDRRRRLTRARAYDGRTRQKSDGLRGRRPQPKKQSSLGRD